MCAEMTFDKELELFTIAMLAMLNPRQRLLGGVLGRKSEGSNLNPRINGPSGLRDVTCFRP
jgi:hypothetical protein